jgi:uncharacterized protein
LENKRISYLSIDFIKKAVILCSMLFFILNIFRTGNLLIIENKTFANFSIIFISIVLEALPFIILGAFIAALIQVFVREEVIQRVLPKNNIAGIIAAAFIGIIFPVCECAVVPIARRLIKKGVPVNIAVTMMLSVPIVNPIVILSTYYAFSRTPSMVFVRVGFGVLSAVIIGLQVGKMQNKEDVVLEDSNYNYKCSCGCDLLTEEYRRSNSCKLILEHTTMELFDIGKFLILGAFISSIFQTLISRDLMSGIGRDGIFSILAMQLLAFILSICSEADAFIARSFLGQFTTGSVAAFLILGPMIDIKNTLMLSKTFKKKFIGELILYIFVICFFAGCIVNLMELYGVI